MSKHHIWTRNCHVMNKLSKENQLEDKIREERKEENEKRRKEERIGTGGEKLERKEDKIQI